MMKRIVLYIFSFLTLISCQDEDYSLNSTQSQSVARQWNEVLLKAIEHDYARPTIHARNLYHTAIALYDSWAIFDSAAETVLLGKQLGSYHCDFNFDVLENYSADQKEEIMSYASYRLLWHRFITSPAAVPTLMRFDSLMMQLNLDIADTTTDYKSEKSPAALGNYIANCIIEYGLIDGANEQNGYENKFYLPINPPLEPKQPSNPNVVNLKRWQPLKLETFIDQSGNILPHKTPECLSPEWGYLIPYAMDSSLLVIKERNNNKYPVYYDPGDMPEIAIETMDQSFKWNFELVSVWSAHLDPQLDPIWDISPASIGNLQDLPESPEDYLDFFDLYEGGVNSPGYDINPITGKAYKPQLVPRGDYARVIAEFWADGPNSETPPGHWHTIFNYVSDHPELEKRLMGKGPILSNLEWDIKGYLALSGALYDASIAAWSIKGWYDFIRPVSVIRLLADFGQCTNKNLPNYDSRGIDLLDGYIDVVTENDELAGVDKENVGKIKLYTWKGHDQIKDVKTEHSGVGWILAEHWWPYQRATFVTPPFQGFVSGHSTFSAAAAKTMAIYTGSAFFPGGLGEFVAKKNEYLEFENGPSVDVVLQWATYKDASDQCSLSRIWGGIHPPIDDLPGRKIGRKIGISAFQKTLALYGDGDVN